MKTTTKLLVLLAFLALLAGCGGGGASCGSFSASCSSSSGSSGSSSSSTGSSSSSSTSSGGGVTVELGSGTGTSFKSGVLAITATSLPAGGTTTISATLQNSDSTPYIQSATVNFTSTCTGAGTASLNPASVTTTNGAASSTYTAMGCSGTDTVTATATIGSSNLIATGTLSVQAPQVQSIKYIVPCVGPGCPPTTISLQGTGGVSSTTVTFEVDDANGNPVPGVTVNFATSTSVGGLSLTPSSAPTNNTGQAITSLQAGSVHASVSVIATVQGPNGPIMATSNPYTISTGIPTENNVSLAIVKHNPETWIIDGVTDAVTVHLADRFQNPVIDGTQISFTTNGGSIQPECSTIGGVCVVNWTSQNPRPVTDTDDVVGHAHVLAYTVGEESFTDKDGDGVFNDIGGVPEPFSDIGEIFLDSKETGAYVTGEFFYDYNKNGVRDGPDGFWEGLLCEASNLCGPSGLTGTSQKPVSTTTGVGAEQCIVMSTSSALATSPSPGTISHTTGGSATITVSDLNSNVLANGTVISVLTIGTTGVTATMSPFTDKAGLQYTVGDVDCAASTANWPLTFTVFVSVSSAMPGGVVFLQITSPSGTVTNSPGIIIN